MRDIKFSYLYENSEGICEIIYGIEQIEEGVIPEDDYKNYKFIARRQYTGLKDKNGAEIYEGDVLNCWQDKRHPQGGWIVGSGGYHPEFARAITFEDGQFVLDGKPLKEKLWWLARRYKSGVIGNIYENPELLGD